MNILKDRIKELDASGCDVAIGTTKGNSWIYIGRVTDRLKSEVQESETKLKRHAAIAVKTMAIAEKKINEIDNQLKNADEKAAKILQKKRNDNTRHIARCRSVAALHGANPAPLLDRPVVEEYPYEKAFWFNGRKCICLVVDGYESGKYWSIEECMGYYSYIPSRKADCGI